MSVFLIADTHWEHFNIIRYCNRPYANLDEMNNALKKNWNAVVKQEDTVYHLGDFGFGNPLVLYEKYFKNLNGNIYCLFGNHDKEWGNYLTKNIKYENIIPPIYDLKYNGEHIVLSHYPIENWNGKYKGSIHCHGHTHNSPGLADIPNRFNVSVECIGYVPINVDRLIEKKKKI